MKPRIDLGRTSRFIIWEGGGWDGKKKIPSGTAIIVAGPDGEKLPICFDVNPKMYATQCAFFANVGQTLAAAYVTPSGTQFNVSLELARIEALTTDLVQGEAKVRPVLKTLWVHQELVDPTDIYEVFNRYDPTKDSHRPEYQNLIKVAVNKSCTPLDQQSFFWAIPRNAAQPHQAVN
jgi:hypothetical protein